MTISARVHYASLAMMELAVRRDETAPVSIRDISDRHDVPGPFLVQILRTLRSAGWVQSIRGSQGGYRLSVDPTTITLLDIAEVVGCPETSGRGDDATSSADQMLQSFWDDASQASRRVLASARLIDLVDRCRYGDSTMFYI